jgi:choline transport protein
MSEEIVNASTIVPRLMIACIVLNGATGLGMIIVVLFCAGDLTAALDSPTGYPFIEIFRQGTNSVAGANGLTIIVLSLVIGTSWPLMATVSRLIWAFARDRAVPGWHILSKVG